MAPASQETSHISEADIALYFQNLPSWGEHQGKHVLIYGGKVHGFYDSYRDARLAGFDRFGYVPFLVKKVDPNEQPRPLVGVIL
jgi:hypothetical protein